MGSTTRSSAAMALLGAMALVVSACSAGPSPAASAGEASGQSVAITLSEFEITTSATSVPAGTVRFEITNSGTVEHEFLVVRTDVAAADLPVTDSDVPEEDLEVVNEVEHIAPGTEAALELDLAAGHYVLICNLPGHYDGGMSADFAVE